jgi:CTP synthase
MMVVEAAREFLSLKRANSTEFDPGTPDPVVDIMAEQKDVSMKGGTMRLGAWPCVLKPGSLAHRLYRRAKISERHRHRYEVNNGYRADLERAGMIASGLSPDDRFVEIMERPDHPWFLGCQFHPELKSRPFEPHPLFRGLIRAAVERREALAPAERASKVRQLRPAS